jgi:SAM-dependent methyltransferase
MNCMLCNSRESESLPSRVPDLKLRRCTGCNLVFRDTSEGGDFSYDEDYYDFWFDGGVETLRRMKRKTFERYLDLIQQVWRPASAKPRMLDIGCAHGEMLSAASARGFQATGLETSPAASEARRLGYTVHSMELADAGFADQAFELITLVDVLEHIPKPRQFLDEIRRILTPTGALFIGTPDVSSIVARILRDRWPHYKQEHLWYFDRSTLRALLESESLDVEHISYGQKYLTLDYVVGHFERYDRGSLTSLVTAVHRVTPDKLRRLPVRLPSGMVAIALPR